MQVRQRFATVWALMLWERVRRFFRLAAVLVSRKVENIVDRTNASGLNPTRNPSNERSNRDLGKEAIKVKQLSNGGKRLKERAPSGHTNGGDLKDEIQEGKPEGAKDAQTRGFTKWSVYIPVL